MISDKDISAIRENYHARDHNNDYNEKNLGFGLIHYAFIRNIKPDKVLAVGSQRGYIPAILALACKHNGKGMVHFVDKGCELEDENAWGGIGVWKTATKEYWKPLGVEEFIKLHNESTEEYEAKLAVKDRFNYIYIDGDHSYEGVKRDKDLFWEHLVKEGLMVFHDVNTDKMTDYGKCGVKKFWKELEGEKITFSQSAGLGIIQKNG